MGTFVWICAAARPYSATVSAGTASKKVSAALPKLKPDAGCAAGVLLEAAGGCAVAAAAAAAAAVGAARKAVEAVTVSLPAAV